MKNQLSTGLDINQVRDPAWEKTDDPRAFQVLKDILDCANGSTNTVTLLNDECADLVAMLRSQKYLELIASMRSENIEDS